MTIAIFFTITSIYALHIIIRCERVARFRGKVTRRIYKSIYWHGLSKELNSVSYEKMLFSFKKLKVESFFSRNFVNKYYRG